MKQLIESGMKGQKGERKIPRRRGAMKAALMRGTGVVAGAGFRACRPDAPTKDNHGGLSLRRTIRWSGFLPVSSATEKKGTTPPLRGSRRGRALAKADSVGGESRFTGSELYPPPVRFRAYALSSLTPPQGGSEFQKRVSNQNRSTRLFQQPLVWGIKATLPTGDKKALLTREVRRGGRVSAHLRAFAVLPRTPKRCIVRAARGKALPLAGRDGGERRFSHGTGHSREDKGVCPCYSPRDAVRQSPVSIEDGGVAPRSSSGPGRGAHGRGGRRRNGNNPISRKIRQITGVFR